MLIEGEVLIFVDGNEIGTISPRVPLKFAINPGHHRIYGSMRSFLFIRRQIEIDLKPGEVYFYRTYVQCGMWVCSIYTLPTEPSTYYDSVTHKLHDDYATPATPPLNMFSAACGRNNSAMKSLSLALLLLTLTGCAALGPTTSPDFPRFVSDAMPANEGPVKLFGPGEWLPNIMGFTEKRFSNAQMNALNGENESRNVIAVSTME